VRWWGLLFSAIAALPCISSRNLRNPRAVKRRNHKYPSAPRASPRRVKLHLRYTIYAK
jgi:hypothetical protein